MLIIVYSNMPKGQIIDKNLDETVHDIAEVDDDDDDDSEGDTQVEVPASGVVRLGTVQPEDEKDPMYLVSRSCLEMLLSKISISHCAEKDCKKETSLSMKLEGCGVKVKWVSLIFFI